MAVRSTKLFDAVQFGIIKDLQNMQGHDDLIVLARQQLPDDLREAVILDDDQEAKGALDGWVRGPRDPGDRVTDWCWQVGWHDDDAGSVDSQARHEDRSLIDDPAKVEAYACLCARMGCPRESDPSTHAVPEESPVPDLGEGGCPEINEDCWRGTASLAGRWGGSPL